MKRSRSKTKKITIIVISVLAAAALGLGIYNLVTKEDTPTVSDDAIAATVNGVEILESTVTNYIEAIREQSGYTDDSMWALFLYVYGYTPETLRHEIVHYYVDRELVVQYAQQKGLSPDEETIQSYVDTMKAYYSDDEEWTTALTEAGYTEQSYRDAIVYSLSYKAVYATFEHSDDPTEEELMASLEDYKDAIDETRLSRHILFNETDEQLAKDILARLKNGTLTFEEAVTLHTIDSTTKETGGLLSWDCLTTYVDEFQDALDELAVGEYSEPVQSEYGWHIIQCIDYFTVTDVKTTADIPEEILTVLKSNCKQDLQDDAYDAALDAFEEASTVVINDMPEGLSYDVDMSQYESSEEEEEEGEESEESGEPEEGEESEGEASGDGEGEESEGEASGDGEGEGEAK